MRQMKRTRRIDDKPSEPKDKSWEWVEFFENVVKSY